MQIITTITVNQILTESSKKQLFISFQERRQQLLKEIDQLKFEMKRMEKMKKYPVSSINTYFEKEIEKRKEKVKLLEFQIEQLDLLPIGSELKEREIQGLIDVNIGDNWNESLLNRKITVKDGIVVDIK
ncbi:YlqD family protein [Caldibacillus thermoamylovorans]|uniref:YlqD family protein n=1 Tax=Caldibacillus thermoamylovorans TaxID=35841 RepID=UPI001D08C49E|nr:YlqD family protein [Caldibacillus thermoamylovorans]MCB5934008.1 YlqD family protein [Bacillus sp. DFI.2.34]MCB7075292.1 YlqD family protein [Caldibacillus thermoamylovorans]